MNIMAPELNDLRSGWVTGQTWRANCHSLVLDDKDVCLALLKRFKDNCSDYSFFTPDCLFASFNEKFGLWSKKQNERLLDEIKAF